MKIIVDLEKIGAKPLEKKSNLLKNTVLFIIALSGIIFVLYNLL